MKAGEVILCLLICASVTTVCAENKDSIKIVKLELSFQKEVQTRKLLATELANQKRIIAGQTQTIDSLRSNVLLNSQNIQTTADQLGVKIDDAKSTLSSKADSSEVKTKTIWGGILLTLLIVLSILLFYFLHKRIRKGSADLNALSQKAKKLNEDILNQLSLEMVEMQKISSSLNALSKTSRSFSCDSESGDSDHSLIKILADRITFMEMTLFKMDPNVKGYKQLFKSISQMKDNLLANGYELVEMLGKPYDDGMKAVANFNDDDEIEESKRIITAVIKPQINYKGQMIQAAQITVSQNIQ